MQGSLCILFSQRTRLIDKRGLPIRHPGHGPARLWFGNRIGRLRCRRGFCGLSSSRCRVYRIRSRILQSLGLLHIEAGNIRDILLRPSRHLLFAGFRLPHLLLGRLLRRISSFRLQQLVGHGLQILRGIKDALAHPAAHPALRDTQLVGNHFEAGSTGRATGDLAHQDVIVGSNHPHTCWRRVCLAIRPRAGRS